jgi:hypothetical protein
LFFAVFFDCWQLELKLLHLDCLLRYDRLSVVVLTLESCHHKRKRILADLDAGVQVGDGRLIVAEV